MNLKMHNVIALYLIDMCGYLHVLNNINDIPFTIN